MRLHYLSKNRIWIRGSIKPLLPLILGSVLIAVFLFGCGQQDVNKPISYINLNRVGDKAIPATVYIEVINQKEAVEPLHSFTADPVFRR